jgi:hypothetical protein
VLTKTAVSAAIGGTASKLSGGSFANGAQTGAFQQLFNHLSHEFGKQMEMKDGGDISGDADAEFEFEITAVTGEGHKVGHSYIGVRPISGNRWVYFGFWPGEEVASWKPTAPGLTFFGSEDTPTDKTYTQYYSVRYKISRAQFNNFQKYNSFIETSNRSYNLYGYNCSGYALRAAQSVGVSVPLNVYNQPSSVIDWIKNDIKN